MAYQLIKNGEVINTIEAEAGFCEELKQAGEIDDYAEAVPVPVVPPPPVRIITKGAWLSRMGMDGLAIAGSTHPVCVAVSTAIGLQRCVDLGHAETLQLLGLLKAAGQPAASANFPGAGPVTDAKIAAWIGPDPTAAEVFKV